MVLSLEGFWTSMLAVTVMSVVFCLLLRPTASKKKILPYGVLFCTLLIVLRLIFPYEMRYAYVIKLPGIWTKLDNLLRYPLWEAGSVSVSVLMVIVGIWGMGALYKMGSLLGEYLETVRYVGNLPKIDGEMLEWILKEEEHFAIRRKISYREGSQYGTPFTFGIFHPVVALPSEMKMESRERLTMALCHEWGHLCNWDNILKMAVKFCFGVYWWLPFRSWLYEQMEAAMEMRADWSAVRNLKEEQKTEYLTMLLEIAQHTDERKCRVLFANGFTRGQSNTLEKRFRFIASRERKPHRSNVVTVLAVAMFVGSYLFVVNPYYPSPAGTFACEESCALYMRGPGDYDLYLDGNYVGIVADTEFLNDAAFLDVDVRIIGD